MLESSPRPRPRHVEITGVVDEESVADLECAYAARAECEEDGYRPAAITTKRMGGAVPKLRDHRGGAHGVRRGPRAVVTIARGRASRWLARG